MSTKVFLSYLGHTLCYGAGCMFYLGFMIVGIFYGFVGDSIFSWVATISASVAVGSFMAISPTIERANNKVDLKKWLIVCSVFISMIATVGTLTVYFTTDITKEETIKVSIPYEVSYQTSDLLLEGEQRTISEGVNGEKTIRYKVTRKLCTGKELKKEQVSENIDKVAKNEIVIRGTGSASSTSPTSSTTPTYNTDNYGSGAICNDGTRSYSTGRGTCSHHDGVYKWL